jgi:predicted protein tyrosine phosphatase
MTDRLGDAHFADAHQIVPRLWLGNKKAAADTVWQAEKHVEVVFNCTKTLPFAETVKHKYRVPVDDNLEPVEIQNLHNWAPEIMVKLLREYKTGRVILVHCHAGMQRSAAVVAMFLMILGGMSADDAIAYIRERRQVAFFPGANFGPALKGWEEDIRASKQRGTQG